MPERPPGRDAFQIGMAHAEEGTAGAREPDGVHAGSLLAHEALEDGAVLGIDGQELVGRGERHEQVATHYERFLVREREPLARAEGGIARTQPRRAHDGVEHAVHVIALAELDEGIGTHRELAGFRELVEDGIGGMSGVGDAYAPGAERARSRNEPLGAPVHRKGDDLELVGVLPAHVERLPSDGSRAAEHGDAHPFTHRTPPICKRSCAVMQPKMRESQRSSMPP